jgi:hypothetical protein
VAIMKADINSPAKETTMTGKTKCIKNEKTINPRLQKIAPDKIASLFPSNITDY